jgi:hypothetical protein
MNKTALCIGINDYPGTANDLQGCVNDAKDWAAELKRRGFTIKMLLDSQATGKAILDTALVLIAAAKKGDWVVITNSSHGSQVPDKNGDEKDKLDECLCPYDIMTKGPVIDDDLYKVLASHKDGVHVVLISDSCHSGSVSRAFEMPVKGKKRYLPMNIFVNAVSTRADSIPKYFKQPGLLLGGCLDNEYSYDTEFNGRPNGAFTYFALQALKDLPENSNFQNWYSAIRKFLPTSEYPQTPTILGEGHVWKLFK